MRTAIVCGIARGSDLRGDLEGYYRWNSAPPHMWSLIWKTV